MTLDASVRHLVKRAVRKCVAAMRQKLSANNKKMLSVVSAGATSGVGSMERLRGRAGAAATQRDFPVRLHADIAINLPPSIPLPDGEDHPFSARLHLRDTEQESEIYQKCVRPPPNRTALESESPPPYRSPYGSISSSSGGGGGGGGSECSSTMAAAAAAPKTDFLQKTVKIFTGKRSQQQAPPSPLLLPPVVVVPSCRTPRRGATPPPASPPPASATTMTSARPDV